MKLEEIIYDILEIKQAAHDDSDIDPTWLIMKINSYRSALIQQSYLQTGEIDHAWIQRYPVFDFEKVFSGDDPSILSGSIDMGKFRVPPLVSLPFDHGLYRVFGAARVSPLSSCDFSTMMYRATLDEDLPDGAGFVSRIGLDVYVYPYIMRGQAHIIAENPLEVKINDNGNVRDMTVFDNYPVGAGMAQTIVLSILTKDLKILEETIPDIINDSQSHLKVLRTNG